MSNVHTIQQLWRSHSLSRYFCNDPTVSNGSNLGDLGVDILRGRSLSPPSGLPLPQSCRHLGRRLKIGNLNLNNFTGFSLRWKRFWLNSTKCWSLAEVGVVNHRMFFHLKVSQMLVPLWVKILPPSAKPSWRASSDPSLCASALTALSGWTDHCYHSLMA